MDASLLKSDEIEIEYEIRGISSNDGQALDALKTRLAEEQAGTVQVPLKMHYKASRKPDTEINNCRTKLLRLQHYITELSEIPSSEQPSKVRQIISRLVHIQDRLQRATSSPTYRESAQQALQACQELQGSLDLYRSDEDKLNLSIDAAKRVQLGESSPGPSETSAVTPATSRAGHSISPSSRVPNEPTTSNPNPVLSNEPPENQLADQLQDLVLQQQALQQRIMALSASRENPSLNQPGILKPEPTFARFNVPASGHSTTVNKPKFDDHHYDTSRVLVPPITSRVSTSDPNQIPQSWIPQTTQTYQPSLNQPSREHFQEAHNYYHTNQTALPTNTYVPLSSAQGYNQYPRQSQNTAVTSNVANADTFGHSPSYVPDRRLLSRSGISYSGSPSGIKVDMFLFQLDTVASSWRLTPTTLLNEIHTILKEVASQWYWTYRKHHPSASWFDFKQDFSERFKDRRTNYEIRRMVESRKQQANESFVDFYQHIWNLSLQCHIPYRDEEFIQILLSNMKPTLQYQLTDRHFTSINDLIKSCTAWEDTFRRMRVPLDSVQPPRRHVNELSVGYPEVSEVIHRSQDYGSFESTPETSLAAYQSPARGPYRRKTGLKPLLTRLGRPREGV